ncbi:30S ribosomal protein S17 [Candidatus Woesearchaeota archaeon]|nr:30S ribosomal protein S17 [Candidatus Woesearchaeota archaeon]
MSKVIDIGIQVENPKSECSDRHCAFHGGLKIRGREFVGVVTRTNSQKTAVIEWEKLHYLPKYQRYEKRYSKLQVHNPLCMNIKVGDKVRIVETRPISKTKNFVIVERLG